MLTPNSAPLPVCELGVPGEWGRHTTPRHSGWGQRGSPAPPAVMSPSRLPPPFRLPLHPPPSPSPPFHSPRLTLGAGHAVLIGRNVNLGGGEADPVENFCSVIAVPGTVQV